MTADRDEDFEEALRRMADVQRRRKLRSDRVAHVERQNAELNENPKSPKLAAEQGWSEVLGRIGNVIKSAAASANVSIRKLSPHLYDVFEQGGSEVTAHPFNRMSFHRTKEGHARALDAGSNPLHRDTPVEDVDERWVTACLKKIFQAHAAEAFERSVRADEAESGYWLDAAKMPKRPSVAGKSQSARPWEDRRDVALAALGKAGAQHQLPLLKEKELKRKEAASLFVKLGFKSTAVSEDWLEKAAVKGSKKNGPPFNKVNGRVTYDLASLLEWFLRRRQQG